VRRQSKVGTPPAAVRPECPLLTIALRWGLIFLGEADPPGLGTQLGRERSLLIASFEIRMAVT
jgi:hypothetical protein